MSLHTFLLNSIQLYIVEYKIFSTNLYFAIIQRFVLYKAKIYDVLLIISVSWKQNSVPLITPRLNNDHLFWDNHKGHIPFQPLLQNEVKCL